MRNSVETRKSVAPVRLVANPQDNSVSTGQSLRAQDLSYERSDQLILSEINLAVLPGEILQIFGANGCGKSTLLRLLAGLLPPTTGKVHLPEPDASNPAPLLYLGHANGHRGMLTPYENLALCQHLHGLPTSSAAIKSVLHSLGLTATGARLCSQLSAGQQRRVALARLQLIPSRIWILDEPATALDTQGQHILEQWIERHLKNEGMVIMATHTALTIPGGTARTLDLDKTRD